METFLNFLDHGNFDNIRDSIINSFNAMKTAGPMDVIDILIVAYIIYRLMKLLKDTSARVWPRASSGCCSFSW